MLCFTCLIAKKNGTISNFSKQSDPAFIENRFRNWKKVKEKFRKHEMCETHRLAALQLQQSYGPSVQLQLLQFNQKSQKEAQKALLLIISSVRFLARLGLAFRGHKKNEGNFWRLLKVRANECPQLNQFLSRKTNFCSRNTQNQILSMLSEKVLQSLTQDVQKNKFYAVIMDGTQDNAGKEQQSVCIRYTTTNLEVEEVFVGLHEPADTTGQSL